MTDAPGDQRPATSRRGASRGRSQRRAMSLARGHRLCAGWFQHRSDGLRQRQRGVGRADPRTRGSAVGGWRDHQRQFSASRGTLRQAAPGSCRGDDDRPAPRRNSGDEPIDHRVGVATSTSAYALNPFANGSTRTRRPVAAATALASAGPIGGVPGSPTPVGEAVEGRICTSTRGIRSIRSGV
jgi:hypothetical protein